jgi:hypothetical protein
LNKLAPSGKVGREPRFVAIYHHYDLAIQLATVDFRHGEVAVPGGGSKPAYDRCKRESASAAASSRASYSVAEMIVPLSGI